MRRVSVWLIQDQFMQCEELVNSFNTITEAQIEIERLKTKYSNCDFDYQRHKTYSCFKRLSRKLKRKYLC